MEKPKIHSTAESYQTSAKLYEQGRPGYTTTAVYGLTERMGLKPENRIVEVGAGTGKFTRLLIQKHPNVIAVEPVQAMREKLSSLLPAISTIAGTGEKIPLPNTSADAVIVANAFHWFDGDLALQEIHRILRPGGALGLIWNLDGVFTSSWGKLIDALLDKLEGETPQYKTGKWKEAFTRTALFSSLKQEHFSSNRTTTPEEVVARVMSISFMASLPEHARTEFQTKIMKVLAEHPDTQSKEVLHVAFDTEIYWCFKV